MAQDRLGPAVQAVDGDSLKFLGPGAGSTCVIIVCTVDHDASSTKP
jgi:hypothetical protein